MTKTPFLLYYGYCLCLSRLVSSNYKGEGEEKAAFAAAMNLYLNEKDISELALRARDEILETGMFYYYPYTAQNFEVFFPEKKEEYFKLESEFSSGKDYLNSHEFAKKLCFMVVIENLKFWHIIDDTPPDREGSFNCLVPGYSVYGSGNICDNGAESIYGLINVKKINDQCIASKKDTSGRGLDA